MSLQAGMRLSEELLERACILFLAAVAAAFFLENGL